MVKVDIRNNEILKEIFKGKDLVSIEEIVEKLEEYYLNGN